MANLTAFTLIKNAVNSILAYTTTLWGPFLILKYLDHTKCPLDEDTYKKAEEQLEIIHYNQIIHGDKIYMKGIDSLTSLSKSGILTPQKNKLDPTILNEVTDNRARHTKTKK
mmetsp:Transcript_6454/g.8091  ORF Transcript_6454/g.8091 Transcript_6454/m.8091 type:complete len:112 (-) Transcript_6454:6467-6802(-)